jgi:hypothetical protein
MAKPTGRPTGRPKSTEPLLMRLWKRAVIQPDGCVVWTGARTKNGYGVLIWAANPIERQVAHRLAYRLLVGEVPDGLVLDHLCRNRLCINVSHLEPVTRGENVMRGETLAAANAAKVQCNSGHPYTPENTITDKHGWRRCRECSYARFRRWWAEKRAIPGWSKNRPTPELAAPAAPTGATASRQTKNRQRG